MHKTGTADCVVDWAGDELLFIRFSSWLRRKASVDVSRPASADVEARSPNRVENRIVKETRMFSPCRVERQSVLHKIRHNQLVW